MRVSKHHTVGRNGPCTTRNYYLSFTDHHGRPDRRLPLPRGVDKRLAEVFATNVESLMARRMLKQSPTPELAQWLENVPPRFRDRLVVLDLLDSSRAAAGRPLVEHIDDFKRSIQEREKTGKHAHMTIQQVKDIVGGCRFFVWSDIRADDVSAYLKQLRDGRRKLSKITSNHYLTSMKAFCDWMVTNKRASESPLDTLQRLRVVKKEEKRRRIALTVEEVERLLEATAKAPADYGMTGYERALLYLFAIETGLRADAIRSLTVSSINFEMGSVVLLDEDSKNGEEVVVPLTSEMIEYLRAFTASRLPWVKLFGGTYKLLTDKTSDMLQADLARTAKKDASGKVALCAIPYKTAKGEHHDFHAFRHTGYSWLDSRGVPRQIIMQIFGHKTMAMGTIYSHPDWQMMKEAVAKLPVLKIPDGSLATGTDGK